MDKLLALLICLASLLLFCGCTDGSGRSNNTAADAGPQVDVGPLDAKSFYQRRRLARRRAQCETAFNDCPDQVRFLDEAHGATSVAECVDAVRQYIEAFDPAKTVFDCGRMTFDEEAARACLENLISRQRADVCYAPSAAEDAACDKAFQPTLDEGEGCSLDDECVSGHCGTGTPATRVCEVVRPTAVEGESCGYGEQTCGQLLRCVAVIGNPDERICVQIGSRQVGEPCNRTDACAVGLICRDGTCIVREPAELGEPCIRPPNNQPSLAYHCAPGLVCTNVDDDYDGTCAELGQAGDVCSAHADCKVGHYCDFDSDICAPYKAPGEACSNHWACGPLASCLASESGGDTCQPRSQGESRCAGVTE